MTGPAAPEGAAGHHLRPAMTELSCYWISLMMLNIGM